MQVRGVVVQKEIGNKEYKNITKDTLLGNSWTEQKTSNPDHRKGIFLSVQSPPEEYWLRQNGPNNGEWAGTTGKRTADGSTGD